MRASSPRTFRSLAYFNYRLWFAGGLVSSIGTWMQLLAQQWLVLTVLTNGDAAAVGYLTALQFGPQVLLLPWSGKVADYFDRRRVLIGTQALMAALAFTLGGLVVGGVVDLWQVYLLAFAQGVVIAFDAPIRQTFVSDIVGEETISNAIALNSTVSSVSRVIGPAVAGVLAATFGTGWAFLINGASYAASVGALLAMRSHELRQVRAGSESGGFSEGLVYLWTRTELRVAVGMVFLLGTFAMNFPIFISTMTTVTFSSGASSFGLLTSAMAVGSVVGALLSARLERPKLALLVGCSLGLGVGLTVAAVLPTFASFGVCLVGLGIIAQVSLAGSNGFVQMSTEPAVRGRVVAALIVAAQGGTIVGAPLVGWVANVAGPRWAIGVGALSGLLAAVLGGSHLLARFRANKDPVPVAPTR